MIHARFGAYGILLIVFGLFGALGVKRNNVLCVQIISLFIQSEHVGSDSFDYNLIFLLEDFLTSASYCHSSRGNINGRV